MGQQVVESRPRETAALTSAIEPLPHSPHGLIEELPQSIAVAGNPIVVVVPTEFEIQRWEKLLQRNMTALFAPCREVGQRVAKLLARCPPLQVRLAGAILPPVKLEPKEIEPRCTRLTVPAERNHPALGGGQLKPELAQTMLQRPKKMARFLLILKRADKIIRVPNQASFALCVPFDDFMKPQIQRVMQIHIGQDRRNNSALGSPRQRVRHLSVGIQHPGP